VQPVEVDLLDRQFNPGGPNAAWSADIPQALDRLIELYTATDKPDEAKKWQAERANYPEVKKAPSPEKN
jgi:hypothetical protein